MAATGRIAAGHPTIFPMGQKMPPAYLPFDIRIVAFAYFGLRTKIK